MVFEIGDCSKRESRDGGKSVCIADVLRKLLNSAGSQAQTAGITGGMMRRLVPVGGLEAC